MRKKIWILAVVLILGGLAVCGFWYLGTHEHGESDPESGIFVMEDSWCGYCM